MNKSQIIESVDPRSPGSVDTAVMEFMGDNNVGVGTKVAVVADPVYPFDGAKGTVRELKGGFCVVEFENGVKVNLLRSVLVPV